MCSLDLLIRNSIAQSPKQTYAINTSSLVSSKIHIHIHCYARPQPVCLLLDLQSFFRQDSGVLGQPDLRIQGRELPSWTEGSKSEQTSASIYIQSRCKPPAASCRPGWTRRDDRSRRDGARVSTALIHLCRPASYRRFDLR